MVNGQKRRESVPLLKSAAQRGAGTFGCDHHDAEPLWHRDKFCVDGKAMKEPDDGVISDRLHHTGEEFPMEFIGEGDDDQVTLCSSCSEVARRKVIFSSGRGSLPVGPGADDHGVATVPEIQGVGATLIAIPQNGYDVAVKPRRRNFIWTHEQRASRHGPRIAPMGGIGWRRVR